MKIECILKRAGGTQVNIGEHKYDFQPDEQGRHVDDVSVQAHIDRFLSITEAYRPAEGESAPSGSQEPGPGNSLQPNPDDEQHAGLLGSSVHPNEFELGDETVPLGDVVAMAFEESGLSKDEWNELDDESRHAAIDDVLDQLAGKNGSEEDEGQQAPADRQETDDEKLARLRAEYEAKFGKKPHGQMKAETIEQKLAEGKA